MRRHARGAQAARTQVTAVILPDSEKRLQQRSRYINFNDGRDQKKREEEEEINAGSVYKFFFELSRRDGAGAGMTLYQV